MARSLSKEVAPAVLICGDDEFAVKQRAKALYAQWTAELGGMDHEILEGTVTNSGEALKTLGRLREAIQTLPFFGSGKVVWLQNCNFLGEERTASAQAVTEALGQMAAELKEMDWRNVRLLISAGKVDKRRVFYKTFDKLGTIETFAGWSTDDRDWVAQAEAWTGQAFEKRGKSVSDQALSELVSRVGPNARLLDNEVEKLTLFVGDRARVEVADVEEICTRNKSARAFALGDALGDRNLPRLLRCLDEELWEVKLDPQRSEIGLLYGLISKVRAMILLKEMLSEGWVKAELDYQRFKAALERVPQDRLPKDRRFNPLAINSYVLFKALPQVRKFSQAELVNAMDLLLRCNQKLVSSRLEESLVLQQTLVQIVGGVAKEGGAAPTRGNNVLQS